LSKLLVVLLQPLNWILGLLVFAVVTKYENRRKRALLLVLGLLFFFTNPLCMALAYRAWETPEVRMRDLAGPFDYAILLGGYARTPLEPRDRLLLARDANRFTAGVHLYHAGRVPKLILTGGSAAILGPRISESEVVHEFVRVYGVQPEDCLLEGSSRNTYENARNTAQLLANQPRARCLLVTSAFHMPRAVACFRAQNLDVIPFPTDHRWRAEPIGWHDLVPDPDCIGEWRTLFKEWAGIVAYRLMGRTRE
jgi:uncharacterized SAM-binding protein YcdF (DUF218 family)